MNGALVVVATPIGNLGDLSPRAAEELTGAELICCEDTRRTGRLLAAVGIAGTKLRRVDEHTERAAVDDVLARVRSGGRVALVTDAGTPGVSDPGRLLVEAVAEAGLDVVVVPGPSAAIAALVGSGLPTDRFVFEGFLPRKGRDRRDRIAALAEERRTIVVYEAPPRLRATLGDLAEVLGGERRAVVGRELTKLHEEFVRGTLRQLVEWAADQPKGEIVLVIEGGPEAGEPDDAAVIAALEARLAGGMTRRDAVVDVAGQLGAARRRVYDLALGIDGEE